MFTLGSRIRKMLAAKRRLIRGIIGSCVVGLLCAGCLGPMPSPFRPSPGPQAAPGLRDLAEAFEIVCRNYRVGPEDLLRVVFQPDWNVPAGSYTLDTLDKISVKFIGDPELNEDVIIRPDGMITLQAIGDIKAAGLTPEALAKRIEKKFFEAGVFRRQDRDLTDGTYQLVTVHVKEFYQKLARLAESLSNIAGGQQSSILVKPDGTIDLPLLDERILAAGHTVPEIERTVNKLYAREVFGNTRVSLSLFESKSRKVFILGQVRAPGAYDITQPITALQALALAGGHVTEFADLTSVILVSKDIRGKPIGRRLDLKRILDLGDMSAAIMVKPYDVLYVPKTYVRDLRLFMDQYFATVSQVTQFVQRLSSE